MQLDDAHIGGGEEVGADGEEQRHREQHQPAQPGQDKAALRQHHAQGGAITIP